MARTIDVHAETSTYTVIQRTASIRTEVMGRPVSAEVQFEMVEKERLTRTYGEVERRHIVRNVREIGTSSLGQLELNHIRRALQDQVEDLV